MRSQNGADRGPPGMSEIGKERVNKGATKKRAVDAGKQSTAKTQKISRSKVYS